MQVSCTRFLTMCHQHKTVVTCKIKHCKHVAKQKQNVAKQKQNVAKQKMKVVVVLVVVVVVAAAVAAAAAVVDCIFSIFLKFANLAAVNLLKSDINAVT